MIAMSLLGWNFVNDAETGDSRQSGGSSLAAKAVAADGAGDLGPESRVFAYASLPVRTAANGGEGRNVFHGRLVTGEEVALHESTQPAGAAPNPAHRIQHSEVICVREGTLEFLHDGKTEQVGSGGVIFVAKGTMHQVRNIGDGPAAYFVVAIGGDVNQ
jgi:mannose-6-phosphate isomerase-like protein (cupin superfamily)